jgi:DNA-binding Lrp family transcriptional regulator
MTFLLVIFNQQDLKPTLALFRIICEGSRFMTKMKPIDYEIISELIRNSRLSDRQIAKLLGTSQPTITRRRTKLEKEGLLDYTAVPDLKKLGFEILAFTFARWNFEGHPDAHVKEMKKFVEKHPGIIFISTGSGLGWDIVSISIHKDYSDYTRNIQDFRLGFGEFYEMLSSFIVSLQSDNVLRNLTFKYLTKLLKENGTQE